MVIGFLDWLSYQGFLDGLRDAALTVLQWFWDFLVAYSSPIWGFLQTGVNAVVSKLPLLYSALSVLSPYLKFANAWFPIDVMFDLIGAYLTFWVCLVVYRTVKSWLPTVSGG